MQEMTENQARQKIASTVSPFWCNRALTMFDSATTCSLGSFVPVGIANLKISKNWPLKAATFIRLADGAKMKMSLVGSKFRVIKT